MNALESSTNNIIAESATDAILTIDSHSRIRYVNPAAERIFGYCKEEMVGQEITVLMPDRYREIHHTAIARYLETGQHHVDWKGVRLPVRHKDGHTIPVRVSFGEYFDADERMFVGVVRDVTEPIRTIEKLRQAMETLRHAKEDAETNEHHLAESNTAKDRFLALVSHELRAPLTPILAAVNALESEELRPWIEIIQHNVELEARLINDLLDLTRISKGKFQLQIETMDVHDLLREVLSIFKDEMIARKLRIETHFEALRQHVKGDRGRLEQVVWNLLKNAMKFTPDGGRITLRTTNVNGRISIEVCDTGIGIEPALLRRIFEAFEQGNETPGYLGGLGLGLTISKELVEMHGGTISAASEGNGKGSTFTVELRTTLVDDRTSPATSASSTRVNGSSARVDRRQLTAGQKLKILLVDDQADTNTTVRKLLERRGYEVQTARTAAEAISAVKDSIAHDAPVDLVISDIGLPDESGFDMLPKLRKICNAPAIALSGYGSDKDIHRSHDAGFQEHITKPFNLGALHETIARLLG